MKRSAILVILFTVVLTLVLPFFGGSGPSLVGSTSARADNISDRPFASQATASELAPDPASVVNVATADALARQIEQQQDRAAQLTRDDEHLAQKYVPDPPPVVKAPATTTQRRAVLQQSGLSCPSAVGGATGGAPGVGAGGGAILGTTSGDIAAFAARYNATRVANCLAPVPLANFRYDKCMETRLIWMAEDPSDDPMSAWGHIGSARSDGVASVGCDGNLAGGSGDTGASVATKWWNSISHRNSLYKPGYTGSTANVCIGFAATHGGVGTTVTEPRSFMRAAARWLSC